MHINENYLRAAIAKARDINQQYALRFIHGNDSKKSIDWLLEICRDYLGIEDIDILKLDVPHAGSAVYSMCVMKPNGYDIALAADLNHCWTRYTICKEVFHILLDEEDYRNLDIAGHTEAVATAFPNDDSEPDKSVEIEFLTEVAAMEFLFPYARRLLELERAGPPNYPAIAMQYRIPQMLVDRYLTKGYMDNLLPFNEQN